MSRDFSDPRDYAEEYPVLAQMKSARTSSIWQISVSRALKDRVVVFQYHVIAHASWL
jgi:hypothetical protein